MCLGRTCLPTAVNVDGGGDAARRKGNYGQVRLALLAVAPAQAFSGVLSASARPQYPGYIARSQLHDVGARERRPLPRCAHASTRALAIASFGVRERAPLRAPAPRLELGPLR